MREPYQNEPFTDFSVLDHINDFQEALRKVELELGQEYFLRIGADRIETIQKRKSINPSDVGQLVGIVSQADSELAHKAILAAAEAFEHWKK